MFVKGNWHLQFSVTVSIQIDIKWFKKSYKFSCPHSSIHIKSTVSSSDKEGYAKSPGVPYRKWKLTTPWMPALMLCIVYMYHAPPPFWGGEGASEKKSEMDALLQQAVAYRRDFGHSFDYFTKVLFVSTA